MENYQEILFSGEVNKSVIKRLSDGRYVPLTDPANTDYQEYLRWLEAGNTPLPAEENN
jgi:hypothetical protein